MEHIQALMTLFFWEHFRELYDRGMIYIGLTPKYRTNINGKFIYFQNDAELHKFIYNHINNAISISNSPYTLKKVIDFSDDYLKKFNEIKLRYSVSEEFLSYVINSGLNLEECIDEFLGFLKYNKKTGNLVGMYENAWHDVNFESLCEDIINELYPIASLEKQNNEPIELHDLKSNEVYDTDILSLIQYIKENFKFKLSYFKGLGEADADELFETSLNPKTRNLIQLKPENIEDISKTMEILFGSNSDGRKVFVKEKLSV